MLLTALGNRIWGHGPHWLGALVMTLGVYLSHPIPMALPAYLAAICLWRAPSSRPWLHVGQFNEWRAGFIRSLWVMPLAIVLTVSTNNPAHMALGAIAVLAVPAAYWLGFRFSKYQGEISELLAGLIIGLV